MPKKRHSLKKVRTVAYLSQNKKCYYCGHPMWSDSIDRFAKSQGISTKQAKYFQCTGEHLIPHSVGGDSKRHNIVAACFFCNTKRHEAKKALTATLFKQKVLKRVNKGFWNCCLLSNN
jgi:5-methylcytosine-specific restriction endonuclease McrA